MNIHIVGAGEIGTHLAANLSEEHHSIVVIESEESVAHELATKIDARVVVADGTSPSTLIDENIGESDLFFSLTSDNNINIVAASVAKELGAKQVICRVHPNVQRDNLFLDYAKHFGIDYVFSPERLAAIEIAKYVRSPDASLVEEIARGHVELQQVEIPSSSRMVEIPLQDLEFPPRVRIGAILRKGNTMIPSAGDVLLPGDFVTLIGEPSRLHEITLRLRNKSGKESRSNVVIFGGGEYGFSLAQMLEGWNCRIRIFESDEARCLELSDLLTNVTVLNADATSLAEMKEEQIGDADFFIAVTGIDEDNVMTCLQAHSLGTKHCVSLIHRADYADAITGFGEHLGILAAVSPREATRKDLTRFITSDRFHLVQRMEGIELIESTVTDESAICGRPVREVEWPENCILVAMLHATRGMVPAADDILSAGDTVYALVTPRAKKRFLKIVAP